MRVAAVCSRSVDKVTLPDGLGDDAYCYFVNSYFADPADPADALGITEYAVPFCSIVGRGNIVATQFHAEKSGAVGLALLERFAKWDGTEVDSDPWQFTNFLVH